MKQPVGGKQPRTVGCDAFCWLELSEEERLSLRGPEAAQFVMIKMLFSYWKDNGARRLDHHSQSFFEATNPVMKTCSVCHWSGYSGGSWLLLMSQFWWRDNNKMNHFTFSCCAVCCRLCFCHGVSVGSSWVLM